MTVSALPISSTPKAAIVSRTKENRWNHTFREEVAPMALERCLTFFPPGIPYWPQGLGIPSLVQFFHRLTTAAKENCRYPSRSWLIHADQGVAMRLDIFQAAAGSERYAGQGVVGHRNRQAGCMAQDIVEIGEQGAAAGQNDAFIDDVARQLRGGMFQGDLNRLDNGPDRFGQGFRHLPLRDDQFLGHAVHQ